MATFDNRTVRDDVVTADILGYDVEALDGGIGKVDDATDELDASFFAVKTGPWILGKRVILPAMTVERIDHDARKVYVSRTKDEIKNAPEYHDGRPSDAYRTELNQYYSSRGRYRDEPAP